MRIMATGVLVPALILLAGCPSGNPGKGTKPAEKAKFTIEGLPETKTVLNGNKSTLTASLNWSGAKEEVQMTAKVTPDQGVTVKIEPAMLKPADEQSVKVIVDVGESAAAGDYEVKLTGKTATGEASRSTTIKVPKKE